MNGYESLIAHLFVLRFPLLTALTLLLFPLVALKFARSLLANLLDLNGVQAFAVTLTACVAAWTSMITGWVVMDYGPTRFGLAALHFLNLPEVPPWPAFVVVCMLPLPLLISAYIYSVREMATTPSRFLGGAAFGYAAAFSLFLLGRTVLHMSLGAHSLQDNAVTKNVAVAWRGYFDSERNLLPAQKVVIIGFALSLLVYLLIGFGHYFCADDREHRKIVLSIRRVFRDIPALAYVLLLCTVACWTLTGVSFFCDAYRLPVSLVVLVYLTLTAQVSRSDHFYKMLGPSEVEMPGTGRVLSAAKVDSVILAACNGGGIQSAAWTAKVLAELDRYSRTIPGVSPDLFARSVRAISSVSGGSVGAMHFSAAYQRHGGLPQSDAKVDKIVGGAEQSSLNEIAWGLVYPDLWRTLTPFKWTRFADRGNALEQSLVRALPCAQESLSSWREMVASGERPANLFNATLTETGGRVLISDADFKNPPEACSQFSELYPEQDLAVVTAARVSATFPFVTPAARPDNQDVKLFHVVDGGYYDNYGMATLVQWLQEALDDASEIKRVLVLQIRGFPPDPPQNPDRKRGWFFQLYAPIETMIHARSCGQLAHNDVEYDLFTKVCKHNGIEVETAEFVFPAANEYPPLSWHLTNRQKKRIDQSWDAIGGDGCMKLAAFLRGSKPTVQPSASQSAAAGSL